MSDQYLGEIRMFAGNFAPQGWALCNGQLLPISQNNALFALLGTTYGGNGQTTFALPNLQGQVPIHWGQSTSGTGYAVGQTGGTENITLQQSQMPQHVHQVQPAVSNLPGVVTDPTNAIPAQINTGSVRTPATSAFGYTNTAPTGQAPAFASGAAGSNLPHPNMQPFVCVTFIIALTGIFPPRP